MGWVIKSIKEKNYPKQITKKRRYTGKLKLGHISNLTQLDEHFQNFPLFTDLKLFGLYSKVVQ